VIDPPVATVPAEAAGDAKVVKVRGEPLMRLPDDLYIPPDALEVFLEAFEGPLDLLLYLIRKQNLDILDIPVLKITEQYMRYIALMRELKLELAAEYLVMAAWLAEIKSRILLPRPPAEEEEQGDPRMELVRRLQEYERFKTASEHLDALPRIGRELFVAHALPERIEVEQPLPVPGLHELLLAFRDVMQRAQFFTRHTVQREPLSVRERMSRVLSQLGDAPREFIALLDPEEGQAGVIVSLLALLELTRSSLIVVRQDGPFAPITVARRGPVEESSERAAIASAED
jgi:segregation and condensation protein A